MNILPPRVLGPLSECSRSVIVSNAIPDATVTLVVTRGGVARRVGHKSVKGTKDTIPLDPGESLVAGDLVNASQEVAPDNSPASSDGPEVQKSVAQFDAVQVLSHLRQCSRGFFLGGMRPGTTVKVLQGATVVGQGDAVDGSAFVSVPDGLPLVGAGALVAQQQICPKPPPASPGAYYVVNTPLPAVEAFPYGPGQTVPAPTITDGLTGCSRSVQVTGIVPGAEVFLEGRDSGWWAYLGPSDHTSATVPLPVKLREGETVSIRQEVGPRCELAFERKMGTVGPLKPLGKPDLAQIDCNTTPTIYAVLIKPEADVEFSVTDGGVTTVYRTSGTESYGPLPAPPMPVGATVRIRQGECDVWSDWSDPQTAKAMAAPPSALKISHTPFNCQDAIPVENVFPLNGYLSVISVAHGELARLPISGNIMVVSIAPSLTRPDDVWAEHHVCGYVAASPRRRVEDAGDIVRGSLKSPLYDGDTTVTMTGAVAGARVELWEETKNRMLEPVRAPFADTPTVSFNFSSFGALRAGWKVYARTWHCGHYIQTFPSITVVYKAPVLSSIAPSSAVTGSGGFTLIAKGANFRSGAKVQWNGADRVTTFTSATELHATILAGDVASVKTVPVHVVNPDGQTSANVTFSVVAPAPPPVVGYDTLLIQNCNTSTFPGTTVHRPIHIYYRRIDAGPPGAWVPIFDSPHDADYDASGHCPASPTSGASFSLDDGATYEVVCTDWDLPGCMSSDPDELTCRRSPVYVVHGKAGGGTKIVIVN